MPCRCLCVQLVAVHSIIGLTANDSHLSVDWADGTESAYPWLWLRDHAHDESTLHPVTQQRQLYTAGLGEITAATSVSIDGGDIVISWSDETEPSRLPIAFLATFAVPAPARAAVTSPRTLWAHSLWNDSSGTSAPGVDYERIMNSEAGLAEWLGAVAEFGFAFATGTPATAEATEALVRRVAYVRETIFGGFWEFTADLSKADTAYTNLELRPHTDGTYSHDAPGLQVLHCLNFDGTGGLSTMVDGFAIAQELRSTQPEHYITLSTVAIPGQYIGDGSHLMAARPVFRHDHTGTLVQVSFNNYDRAPFLLPADEMTALYDAVRAFDQLANDPDRQWRHVLAPGEAMLFDNWRVLHGRTSYTGVRRMCGAYLNHEDFESRIRLANSSDTIAAGLG